MYCCSNTNDNGIPKCTITAVQRERKFRRTHLWLTYGVFTVTTMGVHSCPERESSVENRVLTRANEIRFATTTADTYRRLTGRFGDLHLILVVTLRHEKDSLCAVPA